jgi:pimeloyl-ACP methyl ester carboxylesterase
MISLAEFRKESEMETHYLESAGGRIAFDEQGAGPLVLCVPGMGDLRSEYRFLAPQLVAAGYRVVTMDVRGHGQTSASWPDYSVAAIGGDIVALMGHLSAGPAALIGTSMAAGAAVCAGALAPAAVSRMVLVGPFVRDTMAQWQRTIMFYPMFSRPWGLRLWANYYRSLYPTARPADFATYVAGQQNNLREGGRLEALRAMMVASKQASEDALGKIRAQVLVIMGSRDPDFKSPAEEAQLVAARLHGQVRMIEGAGHYPQAEMPEQTGAAIVAFLRNGLEAV